MTKTRQDAWTNKEDELLSQIVLTYIRAGNTQMRAFEKAGIQLNRTPAACGFRWNAFLRKRFEAEVKEAKMIRGKQKNETKIHPINDNQTEEEIISLLIDKLKDLQSRTDKNEQLITMQNMQLIKEENQLLKKELRRYEEAWSEMGKLWEWVNKENNPITLHDNH